jgi:hypothetical protein
MLVVAGDVVTARDLQPDYRRAGDVVIPCGDGCDPDEGGAGRIYLTSAAGDRTVNAAPATPTLIATKLTDLLHSTRTRPPQ